MRAAIPYDHSFNIPQGISLTVIALSLVLMPGAQIWSTLLSAAIIWILCLWALRATRSDSPVARWTLLTAYTALMVGIVANVWMVTTVKGLTTATPDFANYDMNDFFADGVRWLTGEPLDMERRTRWGYCIILAGIWRVTGISVVPPLMLNALSTLLTIILTGALTRRLLQKHTDRSAEWLTSAGMIACASVMYFLFNGTLLMRESLIGLSVVGMAYGVVDISQGRRYARGSVAFIAGTTLLVFIRSSWIPFVIMGLVAAIRFDRKTILTLTAVGAVAAGEWLGFDLLIRDAGTLAFYEPKTIVAPTAFLYDTPSHSAYNALFGEHYYYDMEWWQKALVMPIAAVIQYFTPFPWAFTRDLATGPTLMFVKFTYPWLAIGGLLIYYLCGMLKRSPEGVIRLTLWAIAYWLVTVYVSAGSVPRYGVPLLPLVIPAAVYVVAKAWKRRSLRLWGVAYAALVAIALVSARLIQNMDLSGIGK